MLTKIKQLADCLPRMGALASLVVLFSGAAPVQAQSNSLEQLFAEEWAFRLQVSPLLASAVGERGHDHRLPDVSPAAQQHRAQGWKDFLQRAAGFEMAALSREQRINLLLFKRQLNNFVSEIEFGAWQVPITSETGFHTDLARLPARTRLVDLADYENYLARLRVLPEYFDQQMANMRLGIQRGWTQPAVVLEDYQRTALVHVVQEVENSVFYAPLAGAALADSDRERLQASARRIISQQVVPAYRELAKFFAEEYIPAARTSIGASAMPDGRRWYDSRVRHFATYEISAEAIHDLGLAEVARIRAEMQGIIDSLEFEGSFAQFLDFLRSDPQFYAQSPEQLLREAAWIAKRMDAALPRLFNHLPRLPYGVAPVPANIAPRYTGGRYVPPAAGSDSPGYYWVNTYKLPGRPLYTLTALTLHEAVPGHHLQHALALEQGQQPHFRRFNYISAYGEGWALYAERLGKEVGLYDDPYQDFGRLTYEMWRACRLVVDTGIHIKGWNRQQVVDFLSEHTALSVHEINTETDRYISWPAQALSYKLGEIKIRQLRERAAQALGEDFSLPAFHDAVLATGSVTLSVLDAEIQRYIDEAR